MRKEPLLTAMPSDSVRSLSELYAIAFDQSQKALEKYNALATQKDKCFDSVRTVFEVLARRELSRRDSLSAACLAACGVHPDASHLRWVPIDLVPAAEIADIENSNLSTPYSAWALGVRHRQRSFVFWTYVIALAEDALVRATAEQLAHDALSDGDLLRRERRLAWRAERKLGSGNAGKIDDGIEEPASAALLESLLLRDMMTWSQWLDPVQREQLLTLNPVSLPPPFLTPDNGNAPDTKIAEITRIQRRALLRAEQLSNLYLDDVDHAADQSSIELAQKLAAQSIMRLAGLRQFASKAALRH